MAPTHEHPGFGPIKPDENQGRRVTRPNGFGGGRSTGGFSSADVVKRLLGHSETLGLVPAMVEAQNRQRDAGELLTTVGDPLGGGGELRSIRKSLPRKASLISANSQV